MNGGWQIICSEYTQERPVPTSHPSERIGEEGGPGSPKGGFNITYMILRNLHANRSGPEEEYLECEKNGHRGTKKK